MSSIPSHAPIRTEARKSSVVIRPKAKLNVSHLIAAGHPPNTFLGYGPDGSISLVRGRHTVDRQQTLSSVFSSFDGAPYASFNHAQKYMYSGFDACGNKCTASLGQSKPVITVIDESAGKPASRQ